MTQLTRDFVAPDVSDQTILDAFQNCTVRCVAENDIADAASGQSGVIAFASLVARMGVQAQLDLPEVEVRGYQPPIVGRRLIHALIEFGAELIPGTAISTNTGRPDLAFLFGNAASRAWTIPTWRVQGSSWMGRVQTESSMRGTSSLQLTDWPVGMLTGAALAAAEVFKYVVRQLPLADRYYERFLAPARFAEWDFGTPIRVPRSANLGSLGIISAGAITQAALFTLFRLPHVTASAYAFDNDATEGSNLNRNMLSTMREVGHPKAGVLAAWAPAGFGVRPVPQRFTPTTHLPSAEHVILGVDDIPSRWAVQATGPRWMGVGATSHFGVSSSSHSPHEPCAGCLHPHDEVANDAIPTVSFVSFWAGLSLAVRLIRSALGSPFEGHQQHLWLWPLRMDRSGGVWSPVAARADCPVRCAASLAVRRFGPAA